jgi:hypothetical protein
MPKKRNERPFRDQTWESPRGLVQEASQHFNGGLPFDFDPCATDGTEKGLYYYTPELDGLTRSWLPDTIEREANCSVLPRPQIAGRRISLYMNCPFDNMVAWVTRCRNYLAFHPEVWRVMVVTTPSRTSDSWYNDLRFDNSFMPRVERRVAYGSEDGSPNFYTTIFALWPPFRY